LDLSKKSSFLFFINAKVAFLSALWMVSSEY
jgi:hypothetical protein